MMIFVALIIFRCILQFSDMICVNISVKFSYYVYIYIYWLQLTNVSCLLALHLYWVAYVSFQL